MLVMRGVIKDCRITGRDSFVVRAGAEGEEEERVAAAATDRAEGRTVSSSEVRSARPRLSVRGAVNSRRRS
eukprot:807237-Pyramimonas_sp.AAC.1